MNNVKNNTMRSPRELARREPARSCEPSPGKSSSQLSSLFPYRLSTTDGDTTRTFTYHADGQLASASNDALGTTVGSWEGRASSRPESGLKYSAAALTAFGEDLTATSVGGSSRCPFPVARSPFFTGKPYVEGLGHAFLMRNYRAGLAKWQTADPMGYPDGWNQLAYCGNGVTSGVDLCGGWCESVHHDINSTYLDRQGINQHAYQWGSLSLDVLNGFNAGSDWTDSIGAGNQQDDRAYLHAMSSENQGLLGAMSSWNSYLKQVEQEARDLSDCARACYSLGWLDLASEYENRAINELGKLLHTFDDSFSPSHSGFQHFSLWTSLPHMLKETMSVYLTGVYGKTTYHAGGYRDYIYDQIVGVYNATVWYVLRQPE